MYKFSKNLIKSNCTSISYNITKKYLFIIYEFYSKNTYLMVATFSILSKNILYSAILYSDKSVKMINNS